MKTAANVSPKEKGVLATMYFNSVQIRELLSIAGPTGVLVMSYYVAIGKQTNPNMEDSQLATLLGIAEPTIKKVRLSLTRAGWFKRIKVTIKGEPHLMYLVGKEAVSQSSFASIQSPLP